MAKDNSVLESEVQVRPYFHVDVVFLLLIYFMYLPIQQEADLMFSLPAYSAPSENVALPSEQVVEINPDGSITLNGAPVDHPGDIEFDELASTLRRLKLSADRSGVSRRLSRYIRMPTLRTRRQYRFSTHARRPE